MTLRLVRFAKTSDGVIGRIGRFYTLEEEDQGNRPRVSCIPAGTYTCRRARYHKGGYDTFEVTNVPARQHILFHKGNTEEDTEGCILIGSRLGVLPVRDEDTGERAYKLAVLDSARAFERWMDSLSGVDSFTLEVVEV